MTSDAFAAALVICSFVAGVSGGVLGVWIARWTILTVISPVG